MTDAAGGATTTGVADDEELTEEGRVDREAIVAAVLDLEMVVELRDERSGFLGGGNGMGGSAGLVFSYRKPTTLVSSRSGLLVAAGPDAAAVAAGRCFDRTEANRDGSMVWF